MSTKKKTKKLRQRNYVAAGLTSGPAESRGGGAETLSQASRADSRMPAFDYTHVKQDMRRIALLAGGCVALLVVLSFFIR